MSNWKKPSAAALTNKITQLRENARKETANSPESNASGSKPNGKQRKTYVQGRGHLAYWAAQSLKTGEAALCLDCAGTGMGRFDACAMCQGKGAVCPTCRGMRFIHARRKNATPWATATGPEGHDVQADVTRCPDCCEGNNVNELLELACIKRYIARSDAVQSTLGDTRS